MKVGEHFVEEGLGVATTSLPGKTEEWGRGWSEERSTEKRVSIETQVEGEHEGSHGSLGCP